MCVCVCSHPCMCMQRSEVNMKSPQLLSTFLMQALSLNLELIILTRLATQRDPDAKVAPGFYMGAGI